MKFTALSTCIIAELLDLWLHTADYRDCTLVINIIPKNLKPESNLVDKY